MDEKLPVGRLNRLTWLQTIIIGSIFYLLIWHSGNTHVIPLTLLTMSGILLVGYSDILLMMLLSKRFPFRSKKFSLLRRVLTYLVALLIYQLLRPIFAVVVRSNWSFWHINSILIFTGSGVIVNTLITMLHDSVLLYEHKLYAELELSRLKTANAEAMNLALKQQIQPHFLFNALNTLKALYHKDLPTADQYIVHMANFLRASISHQAAHTARLEDEITLLNDYLQMQKIRFGNALSCVVIIDEPILKDAFIPAFSLQPLLENAIKHNNFTKENPLTVTVCQHHDWLVISNNIQKKKVKIDSTRFGLANLAERYHLCSGDEIRIVENESSFSVSIKLLKK